MGHIVRSIACVQTTPLAIIAMVGASVWLDGLAICAINVCIDLNVSLVENHIFALRQLIYSLGTSVDSRISSVDDLFCGNSCFVNYGLVDICF